MCVFYLSWETRFSTELNNLLFFSLTFTFSQRHFTQSAKKRSTHTKNNKIGLHNLSFPFLSFLSPLHSLRVDGWAVLETLLRYDPAQKSVHQAAYFPRRRLFICVAEVAFPLGRISRHQDWANTGREENTHALTQVKCIAEISSGLLA